jgi:hypothetical protein
MKYHSSSPLANSGVERLKGDRSVGIDNNSVCAVSACGGTGQAPGGLESKRCVRVRTRGTCARPRIAGCTFRAGRVAVAQFRWTRLSRSACLGGWTVASRNAHRTRWWWDVGGAWYFYSQAVEGAPTYVSDVEVVDEVAGPNGPPVASGYRRPPQDYAPLPLAYAPPPPPAPDPAASAIGGAVVGGLIGGLLTGRPSGAAVGAIAGGTTGAIAGAQAALRPGYYLSRDGCYYRYPSGQYVPADPRSCD